MLSKLIVRIFFLLIASLMCNSNEVVAQNNYVPNGDFEIIDTCPNVNIQPYRSIYYAKPWFQPYLLGNSSDLYNVCDTSSNGLGVPNNFFGYQMPESGSGYAGICLSSGGSDYREYIEVELSYTMQQGREYCISLFVNLVELCEYAVDKIEGHFSSTPIYYSNPAWGLLPFTKDFESTPGIILSDSIDWMHITDTYIANGGERYLTIGNFTPDSLLNITTKRPGVWPVAYYFIDNIQIYDCDSITGVNDINSDFNFQVNPNPVKSGDVIKLEFRTYLNQPTNFKLTDLSGRQVFETELSAGNTTHEIQLPFLQAGLYLAEVRDREKRGVVKLVVE